MAFAGGFVLAVNRYNTNLTRGNQPRLVFEEARQWQIASDAVVDKGILAYADTDNDGVPKFQEYENNMFIGQGGEVSGPASTASPIRFSRIVAAPTRDEKMIGHLKDTGRLDIVKCSAVGTGDTTSCNDMTTDNEDFVNQWNVTAIGAMDCDSSPTLCAQAFDIAYEQFNGRAMVVYANNVAQKVYYCYYDGSSWGPVSNCAPTDGTNSIDMGTIDGTPKWISLKARGALLTDTRTDQLLLTVTAVDSSDYVEMYNAIWDGSSWGNSRETTSGHTDNCSGYRCSDGAWEEVSGNARMDSLAGNQKYIAGTGWSYSNGPGEQWMRLVSSPISNRIAMDCTNDADDFLSYIWKADGSTAEWTTGDSDPAIEAKETQNSDVGWERFNDNAVFLMGDSSNTFDPQYSKATCTGSGCNFGITVITTPHTTNDDDYNGPTVAVTSPNANKIIYLLSDIDSYLHAYRWDGSTWTLPGDGEETALPFVSQGSSTGSDNIPFDFAYTPYSPWSRNWRFYDDETSNNPTIGLNSAAENGTPTNVDPEELIRLRMQFTELGGQAQTDARKKLQYTSGCNPNTSETACTWTDVGDVTETSAVWRFASQANGDSVCANCNDNTAITYGLTGSTQNGTYITDKDAAAGANMDHNALAIAEYDYPIKAENVAGNTTYYFRAYDVSQQSSVFRRQDSGTTDCLSSACAYPSLTTAPFITVSGNVYMDEGSTAYDCSADNLTIGVSVNGGTTATGTCTLNTGAFSVMVSSSPSAAGDPVVVFIDSGETPRGTTVTLAADTTSNITGLKIYQDRVIVSSENATAVTNAKMSTGDNADAGIRYNVATGALTTETNMELHVFTGKTYTPGGTVTTQGAGGNLHLDDSSTVNFESNAGTISGDVAIDASATLTTPSSGAFNVGGSWTNAGTFTHNSGTTTFGSGWSYKKSHVITNNIASELTDYQVKIVVDPDTGDDSGATVYCDGKCQTDYDDIRFTDSNGVSLDYWIEDAATANPANIWVKVPIIPASSTATIYMLYGNDAASTTSDEDDTFELFDNFEDGNLAPWEQNNLSCTAVISTDWSSGSDNYSVKIAQTGECDCGIKREMSVTNVKAIIDYNITTMNEGSLEMAPPDQTISQAVETVYNWESSAITTSTPYNLSFFAADQGMGIDIIAYVDRIRVCKCASTEPSHTSWGTETKRTITSGGSSFNNVTFNDSYTSITGEWTFAANSATVANDFTITAGTVTAPSSTTLTIGGSYSNSGTFTHNSGEVIFDDTAGSKTLSGTMITTSSFNKLTFNGVSGGWTFGNNSATVASDFTITNGAVTAPGSGYTLAIGGSYSNTGTFTHNSGTVTFNKSSATQTLNSGGTGTGYLFNNLTHSGAGTLQLLTNAIDIDGNFSQTAGIFDANSLNQNYAGHFSLSSGTTFTKGGTLTFDGTTTYTDTTGAQDIGAVTIGPSTANTTVTTATNMKVTSLIIGADDTLNISDDTLTITGDGTPFVITTNGTFTIANSTVKYTSSSDTYITETDYYNLKLGPGL